jgi:hypothetical protein
MPDELLRRGDLVLVRGNVVETAGLYRAGPRGKLSPAGQLDRAEWRWVAFCAAPLALQDFGPERDHRDPPPEPEQTPLDVFA